MRILLTVVLLSLVALGGCATTPSPKVELTVPEGGRIGVMFLTDGSPKQVHVGTTMFQNFQKPIAADWGVEAFVVDHLRSRLEPRIAVVQIAPTAKIRQADKLLASGWTSFSLREDLKADFTALGNEHGLDAVLVIDTYSMDVEYGTPVRASGYGVYTRCALGFCRANVLDHVAVRVFSVNPPEYVAWGQYVESDLAVELELPEKIDELASVDLEPAREKLLSLLRKDMDSALELAGLVPAQ
jgi:hypothetical protein